MSQAWLWFGCLAMSLGALIFGAGSARSQQERWRTVYTLNFFICLIAAVLYFAMTQRQGFSVIFERPTFWVRYITWTFSTPLTIVLLSYLARSRASVVGGMVGADVLMIATGLVATISPKPVAYAWYLISCGMYAGLVYLLLVSYRHDAMAHFPRSRKVFARLLTVHLTIWTLYPVVWILAETGLGVMNSSIESASYTLLDVAAKVGFGFLALNSLRQLEQADATQPEFDRDWQRT